MPRPGRLILSFLLLASLGLLGVASVAQGAGGSALSWGSNYNGELGQGTTTKSSGCQCVATPAPATGLPGDLVQIAAGLDHGLGLRADGTVVAWGANKGGNLGNPSAPEPSSTAVPVLGLTDVIEVDAAEDDSLALLANGTVAAWGAADFGELGVPIDDPSLKECSGGVTCAPEARIVPGITNAVAIAAGNNFNLALLADGTVVGWGYFYRGQLGRLDLTEDGDGCACTSKPSPIPGVVGAVAISAGESSAAALRGNGTLVTWGGTGSGESGRGVSYTDSPPAPECFCIEPGAVASPSTIDSITVGARFMLVGLFDGGTRSWGDNDYGQLGTGATTEEGAVECHCLDAPQTTALNSAAELSAGGLFSLARLADGTVVAWGAPYYGELGNGTDSGGEAPSPTQVPGLSGVSSVAAGFQTGFAIAGPTRTLTAAVAGAGSGTVGTNGLVCSGKCAAPVADSRTKVLRVDSDAGGFAGWSGACSGTGPTCDVKLDADRSLTATFGPAAGTKITKAKIGAKKKTATFTFEAPGAITGYQCKLIAPAKKKKRHGKKASASKKKGKAKKPQFKTCTSGKPFRHLKPGTYKFEVRALDSLGPDAKPAVKKFRLKKPRRPKH